MIKSVRIKLFVFLTGFLAIFVCLSIFMNQNNLKKYYLYRNKSTLHDAFKLINENYSKEPNAIKDVLYNLDINDNINSFILLKKSSVIKYSSIQGISNEIRDESIPTELMDIIFKNMKTIKNDFIYQEIEFLNPNDLDIIFIKELDKGEILILRQPYNGIIKSTKIANEFFLFISLVSIILGSIFMFSFSKRITKPIIDLSNIATSVSRGDFSKKYNEKSNDEIGSLGDSINFISDEMNRVMNELSETNAKLDEEIKSKVQRDEMRRKFIANVSHEFKSPIGITKSYAEGLKYNIPFNEEKRNRYYDILIDEADKMGQMVEELQTLSDLESEEFQLEKSVFNISELINQVVKKFNYVLKEKEIDLKVISDEEWLVKADEIRIEQVFMNCLTNAINFIDKERYIEVRVESNKDKARVSIYNTGENIPEEDSENIWKNFFKVDKARTRDFGGIGIGLSIVKSIMEHHKDKYGVINKEFGVEFWFELNVIDVDKKV